MDMTQKISGRILVIYAEHLRATDGAAPGKSLRFAFDKVLGVGAFEAMASELYDSLRAKAAA